MPTIENSLGRITMPRSVVAIIAGLAAMECYGLVGMASTNVRAGIDELLGREDLRRGVEIRVNEDNEVFISLNIVVEYGINIAEVASNVIDRVTYTVEKSTGLSVREVNINVKGVRVGN